MSNIIRIFDLLDNYKKNYKFKPDVLAIKDNKEWLKYSIDNYIEIVNNLSYGLLATGVKPGDSIATITNNRPEWNFIDMAIMQVGAIHIPIYPTLSNNDYKYIFEHAAIKFAFVSGEELLKKINDSLEGLYFIKEIFTFKLKLGIRTLYDLVEVGKENPQFEKLKSIKDSIKGNDLATIIYTSGTTGVSKGVMLSHNNLISNFIAVSSIPKFGEEGKALSFLPLCHVYERMLNYMYQYKGISIYYAESVASINENINDIRPDIMCCVPRVLEKVYDKIQTAGRKQKGIKRNIFFWASNLASRYNVEGENSLWYKIQYNIADRLVLSKWREALGNNFKIIVSGGAAIQPRLIRSFRAAKLNIYEGYGLTETSPVVAVTNDNKNGIKVGTVGPPLKGTLVKIAEDGEILVKGDGVMMGYYKDKALTNKVIDCDGWFHTGDVGIIEPEGQLRITGRIKEIFKTSFGKYIAPDLIENKVKESLFIDNIMLVGENQKFAAALIIPDFNFLKSWCNIKNIKYTTDEDMVRNPTIKKRYIKEIIKFNLQFGATEQIKKIELLSSEWSQASGELTPTLKLKRDFINKKYKDKIENLFV